MCLRDLEVNDRRLATGDRGVEALETETVGFLPERGLGTVYELCCGAIGSVGCLRNVAAGRGPLVGPIDRQVTGA